MRAPPHDPPIERSYTTKLGIPIHTMVFGIGSGAPVGPSMAAMATSTPIVPSDARIGGLNLEMPEKFTGSRVPAIAGWLTKMERYF